MAFTAADVKALREMTGVGMLDCKKALAETDGDMDKAVEFLREKGLAAAQKKAGRIAAEGMAYAEVFSDGAALVEVNAETDFVAQNDQFKEFTKDVCYVVAKWGPVDMETLMTLPYRKTGLTVQQMLQEKVLVIGDNIKIRRFARFDSGMSVAYNHMNGRIGVLLNMEVSDGLETNEKVIELGKDLAMQIAAMNPAFLDKSDVSQETLDKEKEIQLATLANDPKMAAKPDKVKEPRHSVATNRQAALFAAFPHNPHFTRLQVYCLKCRISLDCGCKGRPFNDYQQTYEGKIIRIS